MALETPAVALEKSVLALQMALENLNVALQIAARGTTNLALETDDGTANQQPDGKADIIRNEATSPPKPRIPPADPLTLWRYAPQS